MTHQIVSREEWIAARKGLLTKEKEFTRQGDELNRQRRDLPWVRVEKEYVVSSYNSDFNDDAGQIFHTYSTFGRGGEEFLGIYSYIDVTAKGRDEHGPYRTLADWVRPSNMYDKGGMVEANGRYHKSGCACQVHLNE